MPTARDLALAYFPTAWTTGGKFWRIPCPAPTHSGMDRSPGNCAVFDTPNGIRATCFSSSCQWQDITRALRAHLRRVNRVNADPKRALFRESPECRGWVSDAGSKRYRWTISFLAQRVDGATLRTTPYCVNDATAVKGRILRWRNSVSRSTQRLLLQNVQQNRMRILHRDEKCKTPVRLANRSIENLRNTLQAKFMVAQGWLEKRNALSWDCIEKLANENSNPGA